MNSHKKQKRAERRRKGQDQTHRKNVYILPSVNIGLFFRTDIDEALHYRTAFQCIQVIFLYRWIYSPVTCSIEILHISNICWCAVQNVHVQLYTSPKRPYSRSHESNNDTKPSNPCITLDYLFKQCTRKRRYTLWFSGSHRNYISSSF